MDRDGQPKIREIKDNDWQPEAFIHTCWGLSRKKDVSLKIPEDALLAHCLSLTVEFR